MKTYESSRHIQEAMQEIKNLFGDIVLIPIKPKTKIPDMKGWQNLTLGAMNDPSHLQRLSNAQNLGAVLGSASGGLCTIDLDNDRYLERFLDANPGFHETARTKRVRGCNFWVRIIGEYPPNTKLITSDETPVGEWRADGNQTVIYGWAIDEKKGETAPTEYKFLNEAPPIRIRFDKIVFPEGVFSPNTHKPIRLPPVSKFY